jgi:alpha-2-macroglobulin
MMKWSEEAERRIEEYLSAVEGHLAHKPPRVKEEVLSGLRDHLEEAKRRAEVRGEPGLEAVERILAEMDPPETFAEAAVEAAAGLAVVAAPKGGVGAGHWFALGVAFLVLNAYGVWRWTAAPSQPSAAVVQAAAAEQEGPAAVERPTERPERAEKPKPPRVLRLRSVEQVDVSAERELTLRLTFGDAPDRKQLTRYLELRTPEEGDLEYRLAGPAGPNSLLVRTEPVRSDKIEYVVRAGLPSAGEALAMDEEQRGSLKMEMNLFFRRLEVASPSFGEPSMDVDFNAALDLAKAKEYIEIEPEVEFSVGPNQKWWSSWAGLKLFGDFKPRGIYKVTFKEGMPAANGSSLARTTTRTVHFPPRRRAVRVDAPGRYLAPNGNLEVRVAAANLETYEATLHKVLPQNIVHLALRESGSTAYWGDAADWLTGDARSATNALAPAADGSTSIDYLSLRTLAEGDPRGVYWLAVGAEQASGDGRLLVATDLGLAARVSSGEVLAWVNALGSAEPVAGAAIRVYAKNNRLLVRGETDEHGLARMAIPEGEEPFVVVAERDGDLTYVDLRDSGIHQGEGLEGPAYLKDGEIEAAVFTERGVYRPGETVFVQAIARDGQMSAPGAFPVQLRVRRPDWLIFRELPAMLDEYGSATAEVVLPEYLPTGKYELELAMPGTGKVLGQTTVSMEDFVPPQLRVEVVAPDGRMKTDEPLVFGVEAEHLFGSPAEGLRAVGAATFVAEAFAPAKWRDGWTFGDDEKKYETMHRPAGWLRLAADGKAKFEVQAHKAWCPPAALKARLRVTVTEVSGRSVSGYGSAMVDAYPFYVGMKPAWEGAARAGETQRVELVQVLPDGEPVEEGKPLVMTLSRVTWNSVLRENYRGRYEWVSERQVVELRKDAVEAGGEPTAWAFEVDGPGSYELVAEDLESGAATRLAFDATSPDQAWSQWSRQSPGRVELALDRESYRAGDVARLQVRAPFSGRALLTVETDRIHESRVVEIEKNTAEIEVEVREEYAPNAYCALTLIRPAVAEADWTAHRALGAIPLRVDRPERALQVGIDAPGRARPQAPLEGTVTVRAADGTPASGRATVMVVDEGICLLTAFATPEPLRIFAAQRALAAAAYDLYGELMPIEDRSLEGTATPGGDDDGGRRGRLTPIKANRYKPFAAWRAALPLDAEGRAAFRFDLPEFSGEARLMAVAYNERDTGSASMAVIVKRDVVVQPALPRFLAMGDECLAVVALYNGGETSMAATVRMTCGGPLRTETAERVVDVPVGGGARAEFPLVAGPGPGKALCTIEVEAGTDRYRETIEMAVRPAAGSRVETAMRVLAAGETATIEAPQGWIRESLGVSGALSALPSAQLGRALDYVANYPYGCLEQTASSAFPLLYAEDWIDRVLPSGSAVGDVQAHVRTAVARVISMQQYNGAFATWPFSTTVSEPDSIYALHFLVEAKAAGIDVSEPQLEAALEWARGRLDRTISDGMREAERREELQFRAYLCHVLALAGKPDAGWAARLREQSDRLTDAARAHVASALLLAGEPRQAVELLESMPMPSLRPRRPGHLLDSDVRDASLMLAAWLRVDPQNPAVARLAQLLRDRQRDGHWGNTQDNAMALLAFGKLARQLPDEEQPFAGELVLPNGTKRTFAETNDVAWSLGPGQGGAVTVRNDGPGKAYLWVRHEGVSAEPEAPTTNGVSVLRRFLREDGEPLDLEQVPQGELVVVEIELDSQGKDVAQLVVEDLLPAGLEIENPSFKTSQKLTEQQKKNGTPRHRDARDDRMLIFSGDFNGTATYRYAVRAVTPGTYALPPIVASGMYEPEIRGVGAGGRVVVVP